MIYFFVNLVENLCTTVAKCVSKPQLFVSIIKFKEVLSVVTVSLLGYFSNL